MGGRKEIDLQTFADGRSRCPGCGSRDGGIAPCAACDAVVCTRCVDDHVEGCTPPPHARFWRINLAASCCLDDVIAIAEFRLRKDGWTEAELKEMRSRLPTRLLNDLPWVDPAAMEMGCDEDRVLWLWRGGRLAWMLRPCPDDPF